MTTAPGTVGTDSVRAIEAIVLVAVEPVASEQLAQLLATGSAPLIEPFGLSRFSREAAMADPSSAGTR